MPKEVTFEESGWRFKLRTFLKKMGEPVHNKDSSRRTRRNRTTSLPTPSIIRVPSRNEKSTSSLGDIPLTVEKSSEPSSSHDDITRTDSTEKSNSSLGNVSPLTENTTDCSTQSVITLADNITVHVDIPSLLAPELPNDDASKVKTLPSPISKTTILKKKNRKYSQKLSEVLKNSIYRDDLAKSVVVKSVSQFHPITTRQQNVSDILILNSKSLTDLLKRAYPDLKEFNEIKLMYGTPSKNFVTNQLPYLRRSNSSPNLSYNTINRNQVEQNFSAVLDELNERFRTIRLLPLYSNHLWNMNTQRCVRLFLKIWEIHSRKRNIFELNCDMKTKFVDTGSKIGNLYIKHYLRTSDTNYLRNAFALYFYLRSNKYIGYLHRDSILKKANFYTRYILICLLLNYHEYAKYLIHDLDQTIQAFNHEESSKWTQDLGGIKAVVQIEPKVIIINQNNETNYRLHTGTIPSVILPSNKNLHLREVLLVGSRPHHVLELSIDMIRMIQALERDWLDGGNDNTRAARPNYSRHLLYKPSLSTVLKHLAEAISVMPRDSAMLLYISAEGLLANTSTFYTDQAGFDVGGVLLSSKPIKGLAINSRRKDVQGLYPGDLVPFTRRPLFVIVDSDNSYAFENVTSQFGEPLMIIMSPMKFPNDLQDYNKFGGIFTMFLQSSLDGFCFLCNISTVYITDWKEGQSILQIFNFEATRLLSTNKDNETYLRFMNNDFFLMILLRYVFCEVTLRMHNDFRNYPYLPRASPPLPEDVIEHHSLKHIVLQLASHLQVYNHFCHPSVRVVVAEKRLEVSDSDEEERPSARKTRRNSSTASQVHWSHSNSLKHKISSLRNSLELNAFHRLMCT